MLKKILLVPLALAVMALTAWAIYLVTPEVLSIPFLILLAALLFFPLPLLPAATALPSGKIRTLVHRLGEAVIGTYLYFLILLVLDALICIFAHFTGFFEPNLPLISVITLIILAIILTLGALNARKIKVVHHKISLSGQENNKVRAVLISDLHLGFFSSMDFLSRMVNAINDAAPTYLFIAGDLFDSDMSELKKREKAVNLLKSVNAPGGVFMCMGNHDIYASESTEFGKFIKDAEITLLHDQKRSLEEFDLIGRSDVKEKKRMALKELVCSKKRPQILLCHNPKEAKKLVDAGADLVLCGHTHNGQTFPGNIASKIKSKYSYGCNRYKNGTILTTAGVGYWGIPLRIFTNNEIVILDLYY